eukprot:6491910-Amphidinium_carterae.2
MLFGEALKCVVCPMEELAQRSDGQSSDHQSINDMMRSNLKQANKEKPRDNTSTHVMMSLHAFDHSSHPMTADCLCKTQECEARAVPSYRLI